MTWQITSGILGVLGFVFSLVNGAATLRWRTVGNQAALLSELRPLLTGVLKEVQTLRQNLSFDRYDVSKSRPTVPDPPKVLDTAIEELPALSGQLISPSQARIEIIQGLMVQTRSEWQTLVAKLANQEVDPDDAMQTHGLLEGYSRTLDRLLNEYIEAVTRINKGKLWTRFKYRQHWAITDKLFRFKQPRRV